MNRRYKRISLCIAFVLFIVFLGISVVITNASAEASADDSVAFFLNEDRNTKGIWYRGENGEKNNRDTRNYGKEGAILLFHWAYENGQPYKNVNDLNDFNDNSDKLVPPYNKPHYVEYPTYMNEITADINGYGDKPHGYWNANQASVENTLTYVKNGLGREKFLLPISPENQRIMHSACLFTREDVNFRMNVNDDEWHVVTAYVGSLYDHETNVYTATRVSVSDLNGNLLATRLVDDANKGVYVSFAVKGSYSLRVDTDGNFCAALNALFFDAVLQNENVGTSDLVLSRDSGKAINLEWENLSAESVTGIYRKEASETDACWQKIAQVKAGVNEYTDTTCSVRKEYEYMLASGIKSTEKGNYYGFPTVSDVTAFSLPDFENTKTIKTAEYKSSSLRFTETSYDIYKGETVTFGAYLTREGSDGTVDEPYAGVTVYFRLDGESLYTNINAKTEPNVNVNIGSVVTDENGYAEQEWTSYFASDMKITAYIEEQADPVDPKERGYDACSASSNLVVREDENDNAPVLFSVTDEIRPGDTVTVTGNFIDPDDTFTVAYAPNSGKVADFDETNPPVGVKYLDVSDMSVTDAYYKTGVAFVFPESAEAGVYDIWIRNKRGWSNGITINAARPMYINQEASYEGLPIQVVGRNFLLSSFGAATQEYAQKSVSVKLVRTGDVNGKDDGIRENVILNEANGHIDFSTKYSAQESYTGNEVAASNAYRLTFLTPKVRYYGTYDVFVSNSGDTYVPLEEPQTLVIYERKAQNWDTKVFGSLANNNHIGNDPLDLQVYWAQDLNYTNVYTMTPNGVPTDTPVGNAKHSPNVIKMNDAIQKAIDDANKAGGGVVYFPEGVYCFYQVVLHENVMLVGAGQDKTVFLCDDVYGEFMIYNNKYGRVNNLGVARVKITDVNPEMSIAGRYFVFGEEVANKDTVPSKNVFLTDVYFDLDKERVDGCGDALAMIVTVNNIVLKNLYIDGGATPYCPGYMYMKVENLYFKNSKNRGGAVILQASYCTIENCYIDMGLSGARQNHGPSIRANTYFANNVVKNTGQRYLIDDNGNEYAAWSNDGEALLIEPASTQPAHGKVLYAAGRKITLDYTGGKGKIDKTKSLLYNRYAVMIIEGRGAGQQRYISYNPTNDYGTEYTLIDGEKDWDVLPDSTSVFVIDQIVNNLTVYGNLFEDCKCGITVYYCGTDVLIKDNVMKNSSGITITSVSNGLGLSSTIHTTNRITVDGNRISGVAPKYNEGIAEDMIGGIIIQICKTGSDSNMIAQGITVRNNELTDLIPKVHCENQSKYRTGIIVYCNGNVSGSGVSGDGRYIVIENNAISGSEWGVYCEDLVEGLVIRKNSITGLTLTDEPVMIKNPTDVSVTAYHRIIVNGKESDLSGDYSSNETLPSVVPQDGRVFIGYSLSENDTDGAKTFIYALGYDVTIYAVFGYEISFDLNYIKSDGTAAGEYDSVKVRGGVNVTYETETVGEPFRKGKDFLGWYTDSACMQAFDATSGVTQNTVLYAKWSGEEPNTEPQKNGGISTVALVMITVAGAAVIAGVSVLVIKTVKRRNPSENKKARF